MSDHERASIEMANPGRLATLLRKEREALIDRWLDRVLNDPGVPTANKLGRPALEDNMPVLLDRIIERTAGGDFDVDDLSDGSGRHSVGAKEIGTAHAEHRFDVNYTAEETIRELSIFREVLLELCAENRIVLTLDESKVVHLAIDEMMAVDAKQLETQVFSRSEQVMAIVAHDLRNPLNIVDGYAQLLKMDPAPGVVAAAQAIERSTKQMTRLIEDLLAMSQLELGHMSIQQQEADARELVTEVLDQFRHTANRKGIALTSHLPEREVLIGCDPLRIEQAIGNLVSNAIKFTPHGGRVWVELERTGTRVIFRVCDTGSGIAPEQRPQVFRPFWQGGEAGRHGVGLGLAIVRGIVDAHGGSVSAHEAPGGGAMFCFTLPVLEEARSSKSFRIGRPSR
ncbi:sensor histidine kinase [Pendulispora brunnea]|uniref:histidine kinase n=1 Tax=Pendulispora brunnea TaxID=2905690 RepID=A0ABZ2K6K2_9BACT